MVIDNILIVWYKETLLHYCRFSLQFVTNSKKLGEEILYIPYSPLSQKGDQTTYVSDDIAIVQEDVFNQIREKVKDFDAFVAKELMLSKEELFQYYSAEQIDSIGIAISKIKKNAGFIIADETGIGKGRILAGVARYAHAINKPVIFFTEKEHLFSDFYRDLVDTNAIGLFKNILLLHPTAKVYDQDGNVVLKSSKKKCDEAIASGDLSGFNLIISSYSQVSTANHKKVKLPPIKKLCEDGAILILDESHNASGNSNCNAFFKSLLDVTKKVIYSSATFIANENQLDIYKPTLGLKQVVFENIKMRLANGVNGELRSELTKYLTKNLSFLRREHKPLSIEWQTVMCQLDDDKKGLLDKFSHFVRDVFEEHNEFIRTHRKKKDGEEITSPWYCFGANVNRLSRTLVLLLKVDGLLEAIEKSLSNNHKPVIVIDSTMQSMISAAIEALGEYKHNTTSFSFDLALKKMLYEVFVEYRMGYLGVEEKDIPESFNAILVRFSEVLKDFEALSISPIDTIIERLEAKGIRVGEVSGRTTHVKNGELAPYKKKKKVDCIREFNAGELDVIILTRAGSTGVSLHASATFKDQRPRDLYELEITNRPTHRLQFAGRVNRKNQVNEPTFFAVVTDILFEQRILNIESIKLQKLQAHTASHSEKENKENIVNFYTDFVNNAARSYIVQNNLHGLLGISLGKNDDEFYFVDSLLKRSLFLPHHAQVKIVDFLTASVKVEEILQQNVADDYTHEITKLKSFISQDDGDVKKDFYSNANNVQNVWVGKITTSSTFTVKETLNLEEVLEKIRLNKLVNEADSRDVIHHACDVFLSNNKFLTRDHKERIALIQEQLTIAKSLSYVDNKGEYYRGLVKDIIFSGDDIDAFIDYPELIVIELLMQNPSKVDDMDYVGETRFVTLFDLFHPRTRISFYDEDKKWLLKKYARTAGEKIKKTLHFFTGNSVFLETLRVGLDVNKPYEVTFTKRPDKKVSVLKAPFTIKRVIDKISPPILSVKELFEGIRTTGVSTGYNNKKDSLVMIRKMPQHGYCFIIKKSEFAGNSTKIDKTIQSILKKKVTIPNTQDYDKYFVCPLGNNGEEKKRFFAVLHMLFAKYIFFKDA